jgi:hypothetical protein
MIIFVIYQIHDFCVNNFHYHNVVDYYYIHYQTSTAIACELVAANDPSDHNLSADCCHYRQTGDDCNVAKCHFHCSCFDGDNADAVVAVAVAVAFLDWSASSNKSHLANVALLAPEKIIY